MHGNDGSYLLDSVLEQIGERESNNCLVVCSFVKFGFLEFLPSRKNGIRVARKPVLLLGYTTGFQMWDLDSGAPNLLVSRREGPVRYRELRAV